MEEVFVKLIKEHERVILKVCNMYCQDLEDREDLYQDIIVQLWKAFPHFKSKSKLTTWIYRIALNTAISRFRKSARMPQFDSLNSQASMAHYPDNEHNEEAHTQLYAVIEDLSKVEKAIMLLYLEGAKYKEIAEIMGISETNVGFKINSIKKKLKIKLKSNNYEY